MSRCLSNIALFAKATKLVNNTTFNKVGYWVFLIFENERMLSNIVQSNFSVYKINLKFNKTMGGFQCLAE